MTRARQTGDKEIGDDVTSVKIPALRFREANKRGTTTNKAGGR